MQSDKASFLSGMRAGLILAALIAAVVLEREWWVVAILVVLLALQAREEFQ